MQSTHGPETATLHLMMPFLTTNTERLNFWSNFVSSVFFFSVNLFLHFSSSSSSSFIFLFFSLFILFCVLGTRRSVMCRYLPQVAASCRKAKQTTLNFISNTILGNVWALSSYNLPKHGITLDYITKSVDYIHQTARGEIWDLLRYIDQSLDPMQKCTTRTNWCVAKYENSKKKPTKTQEIEKRGFKE